MTTLAQVNAKIYWGCRRGMLELDLLLLPFFEQCYNQLTTAEQQVFVELLTLDDPTLYQWLIASTEASDSAMQAMVEKIIAHARS